MKVNDQLKNYACSVKTFTLPQLQKDLSLGYLAARAAADRLVKGGYVLFENGTYTRPSDERKNRFSADRLLEGDVTDKAEIKFRLRVVKCCIEEGQASHSLISSKFSTGMARACNILQWMKNMGFVAPPYVFGGMKMQITEEEFEDAFGAIDLYGDDDREGSPFYKSESGNSDGADGRRSEVQTAEDELLKLFGNEDDDEDEEDGEEDEKDEIPEFSVWNDRRAFERTVAERLRRIILTNRKMGLRGALNKAKERLEGVRDTNDATMEEVYERVVREFESMSVSAYNKLRKAYFS